MSTRQNDEARSLKKQCPVSVGAESIPAIGTAVQGETCKHNQHSTMRNTLNSIQVKQGGERHEPPSSGTHLFQGAKRSLVSHLGASIRLVSAAAVIVISLWMPSSVAQGALPISFNCSYRDTTFNGEVDFGSGTHSLGSPSAAGTVIWTFSTGATVPVARARVVGTLYLDKLGSGCARLKINFQDSSGNNLEATQTRSFCGPGFDANNAQNRISIDVSSVFAHANLSRVQLTLGQGATAGAVVDVQTGLAFVPSIDAHLDDRINGGEADFGFRPHQLGSPQQNGFISLLLRNDGVVFGRVEGILFRDSLFSGTSRIITDFQDRNGTTLATRTTSVTGGCCATDSANQASVLHLFNSSSLFKMRVRLGTVSGGTFTATASRTYSFGCSAGTAEGIPLDMTTRVGDDTGYGVQWTVPAPENWHSLSTLDIRFVDEQDEILQLRWDEASNTFSEVNPNNGHVFNPALPGSRRHFESSAVTLFLQNSEVIGSGPTGPSVLLNLHLNFKPRAAGRTFTVQARATDDSGVDQGWDSAGEITVLPR
jgi:hypothetical protein